MDSQTIQDPMLVAHIMKTAESGNIPFQIRQPGGGGTNTGTIQRTGGAASAATIAVPGRYAHTPAMMINLTDYANVIKLTEAALRSLTPETVKRT